MLSHDTSLSSEPSCNIKKINAKLKTFKDKGTLEPNNDSTPNEKAMSVAEGIAQPLRVVGSSKLIIT